MPSVSTSFFVVAKRQSGPGNLACMCSVNPTLTLLVVGDESAGHFDCVGSGEQVTLDLDAAGGISSSKRHPSATCATKTANTHGLRPVHGAALHGHSACIVKHVQAPGFGGVTGASGGRDRHIAEHQLRAGVGIPLLIAKANDVVHGQIDLGSGEVRRAGVDKPIIQPALLASPVSESALTLPFVSLGQLAKVCKTPRWNGLLIQPTPRGKRLLSRLDLASCSVSNDASTTLRSLPPLPWLLALLDADRLGKVHVKLRLAYLHRFPARGTHKFPSPFRGALGYDNGGLSLSGTITGKRLFPPLPPAL